MATKKSAATKSAESQVTASRVITPEDVGITQEQRTEIRKQGFSQCVRALLQNWRQGTVACKGRSDVAFSGKKPWKQKGTGRARAGTKRSPLWRKGGVSFGPQPRTRTMAISKNLKRNVANSILWNFLDNKMIVALDWAPQEGNPKTAQAFHALKSAGVQNKNIILFVSPADRYAHASFANIPNVRMLLFDQWNAYDISNGEMWMFLQKDMDSFKEMVSTWI